jgi:hypothetical protein
MGDSVDALRSGQVRQVDFAAVDEVDLVREEVPSQPGGSLGADDLSS